jgi:scyllo-inositol 2-dehydrogenase (NAD+)
MPRVLNFGVVGVGRMGLWHARNLKLRVPGAKLVAVSDVDKAVAKRGSEATGVPWYQDYRKLLALKELDAVCVVTSTDTHAKVAADAVERGLHVFVEKPMATTTKDADRLERAVRKARVKLQVGFMRRFDPAYLHARKRIIQGDIGRPILFKSISRDPFPPPAWACDPKHGGGLQLEMHTHDYDLGRWCMQSEVDAVFATAECLVFPELKRQVREFVDHALITLRFANRSIGMIEGSLNAKYGYDVRMEVLGTEGMVMVGSVQRVPVVVYTAHGGNAETSFLGDRVMPHFAQRFDAAYLSEMIHFVKTIKNDLLPEPSVDDGRTALDIGLAALKSTDCGKLVHVA